MTVGRLLVGVGAGAGIGALFGSIVPGPGTIIGAAVGATIGGLIQFGAKIKKARHKEESTVQFSHDSDVHEPSIVQYVNM